jgi:hypothetical protein
MTLLERDLQAPTIADLHAAAHYRPAPGQEQAYRELLEYALARPELAGSWCEMLKHRLARL